MSSSTVLSNFYLANELGIIRQEGVFSNVDALTVDTSAGQPNGAQSVTVVLEIASDVTSTSTLTTSSFINPITNTYLTIPAGSVITKYVVSQSDSVTLNPALELVLGFMVTEVTNTTYQQDLAGRVASSAEPITGPLLTRHQTIGFDQHIYATQNTAANTIYDATETSLGITVPTINYGVLTGNTYVGERLPIIPCYTVTAGTLNQADLSVVIVYSPPAYPNPATA